MLDLRALCEGVVIPFCLIPPRAAAAAAAADGVDGGCGCGGKFRWKIGCWCCCWPEGRGMRGEGPPKTRGEDAWSRKDEDAAVAADTLRGDSDREREGVEKVERCDAGAAAESGRAGRALYFLSSSSSSESSSSCCCCWLLSLLMACLILFLLALLL